MAPHHREHLCFAAALTIVVLALLGESLVGGKILSPADNLATGAAFGGPSHGAHVPANRLLMDPVLQFQPWLEWNRVQLRAGHLPLWNPFAGCGAPHLANAQSGVFDPFHLLAYLGSLPDAHAWMAAARLLVAGWGMYFLARSWGLGIWGRFFAGLTFPLSGFLVCWLLYPVTSAAVWLPWVLLATDRLMDAPSARRIAAMAATIGASLLAGHVQTTAHILLASALLVLWRRSRRPENGQARTLGPVALGWIGGMSLGAIVVIPLAFYLGRSPVWADREQTAPSPLEWTNPRLLDATATVAPYAFGSQRRGHPNLARPLGVHNLNESAGSFAGMATVLWLLPAAWSRRRALPAVPFLLGVLMIGFAAAFEIPPVANVLRAIPVIRVIDHRRLTLWVAFALTLLGGIGLDALQAQGRLARVGIMVALAGAISLTIASAAIPQVAPWLRERASAHYQKAASADSTLDSATIAQRADRQVGDILRFVPRYALYLAAQLGLLAGLASMLRASPRAITWVRPAVLVLVLLDLFAFGFGLNPAIAREWNRPVPPVIAHLQQTLGPNDRALGIGAELLPNTLMRYRLADLRNYDSVESANTLRYFDRLYEPGPTRTCRRDITWAGVGRVVEQLRFARVAAVVGATPPPAGLFDHVEQVGNLWVGHWSLPPTPTIVRGANRITVTLDASAQGPVVLPESYEPGWKATVDGKETPTYEADNAFIGVNVQEGARTVALRYDPVEVRLGMGLSLIAVALIGWAAVPWPARSTRRKTPSGAWSRRNADVRIEPVSHGSGSPANH